jgi:CheY-like chemotaxis protein
MDRIFDPYFTTREVGRGSGLGLAEVHGIVKSHGGSLLVESRMNEGTEISIFFPAIGRAVAESKTSEEMPTGSERILFVDDEEMITGLGRERLERLGYQVETENDPLLALERVRSGQDHFDLIITDMAMPKMSGARLSTEIRKISPATPVILCTGYSDKIDEDRAMEIGIDAFMMKPVDMRRLARTVRKVLDGTVKVKSAGLGKGTTVTVELTKD